MLRRTTGRLILLLLVITGSAGTIQNHALNKQERKYALGLMKETQKEVTRSVKGLSAAQLSYRPAPDRWTVEECVYHIAASEKLLGSIFEEAMKKAPNPEKRAEIKITDNELVQMATDRSKKNQTPESLRPGKTGFKNLQEALAAFKESRTGHIKYMRTSTEDLRNRVVQLAFGWIDCYQLYLFIAAHNKRHLAQLEEVKAAPGFPGE